MASMVAMFFTDVKGDKSQAVKASLLSNSGLATAVHPVSGQTALQEAVQCAGESVIRALRRHGARWTDVDNAGNNAVHYVSKAGRADLCKSRKSADWVMALHQPNAEGETPLHATLSSPESTATADIIHAFVNVGADINRRNAQGKSAIDLAEDRMHLVQLMHEAANSALGNVATSYFAMGGESSMGGNTSFSAGGGSMVDSSMHEGHTSARKTGEVRSSSRHRSSSLVGERSSASKARSPARRSPSIYSDRTGQTLDRYDGAAAPGFASSRTGEPAGSTTSAKRSSLRSTDRRPTSATEFANDQEHHPQGHGLGWMGGGNTWGFSEQEQVDAQTCSPVSSLRSARTARNSGTDGAMRRPAPVRTSLHSHQSEFGVDAPEMTRQGSRDFSTWRTHRMESVRHGNQNMSVRYDDDMMTGAESPSTMSARTHRTSHSRRDLLRPSSTRSGKNSYSAMSSEYDPSGRGEQPPRAPGMRAKALALRSRETDSSMAGHSPRRALPGTPGSVHSIGNGSVRGEGRSVHDQVRHMQHALEKAASAMRQLQEDRKADSSELSDFAKCMDAMTERMDIMDRAMQKMVDDAADSVHRSGRDYEARDDIEKLAESMGALEAQTDEMKQWLRHNDDKLADCWGQIEDVVAQVGGETHSGGLAGMAGVMDALEVTVREMKKEVTSVREQQERAAAELTSRGEQTDRDGEAVQATLAELKEEMKRVWVGQQRAEEQASKALRASASHSGVASGATVGAASVMAAVSGGGASTEELQEVKEGAETAKQAVADVCGDVDVKGAMLHMRELFDNSKGDWKKVSWRVDELHREQKLVCGQLTQMSSMIERMKTTHPSSQQATREIAQEASREVAAEAVQTAARHTAREVAQQVAKETAMLAGAEAAQAAVQESRSVRDADIGSLSPPSTPKVAMPEVLDRLHEVERKVDLLEDRIGDVAAGAKGYVLGGAAEVRGAGASSGSGGSYSPPRTPDARDISDKPNNLSLSLGTEGSGLPEAPAPPTEREVTASRAMLYTNVYSGPSQSLEFSEFNMQLTEVKEVADVASKGIGALRQDLDEIKLKLKERAAEQQIAPAAPKTLGSGFDDDGARPMQEARLREIQGVALRADAAREETEESLGIMEGRLDRAEHSIQLLQHALHQHDERISKFMYSPARNAVAEGSYALKTTVEALENKIMQVEVQYAGRLQAQKAKNDQQAALIQGLLERVSALEHRGESIMA